jgi:cyclopropane fatty-acyl-phospholipid synthase-like methyltransferase
MKNIYLLPILLSLFFFSGLNTISQETKTKKEEAFQHEPGDDANTHMHRHSIESMARAFESEERDEWQKPDEVIEMMVDLKGKTIMDIGSGTGYFSFRIADKGAKVICADVDDRFLEYIREKKEKEGYTDQQIELRKVPYDAPGLKTGEVDKVIIVNTYHHIEDRAAYFAKVKKGLKEGGELYVIDFFKEELDFGPPVSMKLTEQEVLGELFEAGFTSFSVDVDLLPYQYFIIAE